jgi:uncharacterized protein YbjT (DUF2867 family)
MRVFLTGASGYIGGAVAVKLVNAGAVVRGLVRDPGKAEALAYLGVEPVLGTLDDADPLNTVEHLNAHPQKTSRLPFVDARLHKPRRGRVA